MYRIVPDPAAREGVAALPDAALPGYAEVLDVLRLKPWGGRSISDANPDGEVRQFVFGPGGFGIVDYLIVEHDREVHILRVLWGG